jgi:hypothetical protein
VERSSRSHGAGAGGSGRRCLPDDRVLTVHQSRTAYITGLTWPRRAVLGPARRRPRISGWGARRAGARRGGRRRHVRRPFDRVALLTPGRRAPAARDRRSAGARRSSTSGCREMLRCGWGGVSALGALLTRVLTYSVRWMTIRQINDITAGRSQYRTGAVTTDDLI